MLIYLKQGDFMYEKYIEMKIRKLPEELQREILDYTEYLIKKYNRKKREKKEFLFNWEGKLSDLKGINSVELQHKSMEWR